jgi:lipopolysaccharide export LptBFGC system permease protein LptF
VARRQPRAYARAAMRRIRPAFIVLLACAVVLVAGAVVYGNGRHGLGGAILAVGLIGFGFLIAGGLSSQGRAAEQQGMMGRRTDISGFDRPRDQSGL